jgi:hypothetical protein
MAHLRAIITGSTPFLTFYKFRDNMILEELTLGPNTLVPSSQPFYSNNTLAPPPLAQFHPLVMVARVKDRVVIVAATVARAVEAMTAVATTTLPTKATRVKASRIRTTSLVLHRLLNPPSAIIGLGPSTCTLLRLRGGGGSSNTAFRSSRLSLLRLARLWSAHRSHHPWRRSRLRHRCMPASSSRPHLHP